MTKIVTDYPPNYDDIVAVFGPLPDTVVFAWEGTIYSPSTDSLPGDLIAHEETHFKQQKLSGGAEAWWRRYLVEPEFRLEQEIEAYLAQIRWHPTHAERVKCWRRVAGDLSGKMYGWLVTPEQARRELSDAVVTRR